MNQNSIKIFIAAFLWGILGIFVRNIGKLRITSLEIVFIRAIFAAIFLAVYIFITNKEEFKIRFKDIWIFIGSGILSIVFFNYCYFITVQRTSLSIAATLLYTAPAFVIILAAVFLKEKIGIRQIGIVLLAMIGCALVSGFIGSEIRLDPVSFIFGLGSGLGYALYSIFGKIAIKKQYSSITITFYTFFIAGITTLPFLKVDHIIQNAGSMELWYSIIGLSLFSTVFAFLSYTSGLEKVNAGMASVIACLEPVVATAVSCALYHESLHFYEILGIVCVLGSSVIVELFNISKKKVKDV